MSEASRVVVRAKGEWADFFWSESTAKRNDGTPRNSVTWCCVSSFGCYGHYWYDIGGTPFSEFAAKVDACYLLSKISKRVPCDAKIKRSIKRAIFTSRATKGQKKDAARAVNEYFEEGLAGDALAYAISNDFSVGECNVDWEEVSGLDWEPEAVRFCEVIWPEFVKHLKEHECKSSSTSKT